MVFDFRLKGFSVFAFRVLGSEFWVLSFGNGGLREVYRVYGVRVGGFRVWGPPFLLYGVEDLGEVMVN